MSQLFEIYRHLMTQGLFDYCAQRADWLDITQNIRLTIKTIYSDSKAAVEKIAIYALMSAFDNQKALDLEPEGKEAEGIKYLSTFLPAEISRTSKIVAETLERINVAEIAGLVKIYELNPDQSIDKLLTQLTEIYAVRFADYLRSVK